MYRRNAAAGILILLALWLAGCVLARPQARTSTPNTEERVQTAAAMTVAAMSTKIAGGEHTTLGAPTLTGTPVPSPTARVTSTVTATPTPGPTATPTSSEPCNQSSFTGDVTIPDGSVLPPNTVFIKTWEIKNSGSCAWDSSYSVIFAGKGNAMGGSASAPILAEGEVKPGETARISVTMRAPDTAGEYEGYWMLRSADKQVFGTGKGGGGAFYVKIQVADSYSFAEQWCSAKWSSGAGELPCPGKDGDPQGYALQVRDPTLEDSVQREGLGLAVAPQPLPGGYIAAAFPPVVVPQEADFRATLGCQVGVVGCYVRFKVTYRVDGSDEQVLGEWNEGYEGGVTEAVKDLDMLAGKPVAFTLYVYVNGTPGLAKAVWFFPRIIR